MERTGNTARSECSALIEGIANATAHAIDCYREAGQPPARVRAVGGGTQNRVWLQATSDIARLPQALCERTVGASYGDAFLAALAAGLAEPGDIDGWNPVRQQVSPEAHDVYPRQHALFRRLYEQTKDIAHEL